MIPDQKNNSLSGLLLLVFILINAFILEHAFVINENWYWGLTVTFPLFIVAAIYHKRMKAVSNKNW
jgi:hypothetical protein